MTIGGFSRTRSPLLWLNLVCLDAPLVAVSWQWLFARAFDIPVARGTTTALFLTAWLIYLADRLADNLSLGRDAAMSLRQDFCLRHRRFWIAAIVIVAIVDVVLVATRLDRVAISVGITIGAAAFLYLVVNRFAPQVWRMLPLKEISIGFIFAAGTMVGLVRSLTSAALPAWILFALLCSLNCISIAVWERDLDAAQGRISIATAFPRVGRFLLPALAVVCLTSSWSAFLHNAKPLYFCLAASAVLLALVHASSKNIASDVRTALADLVLLTPIFTLMLIYR